MLAKDSQKSLFWQDVFHRDELTGSIGESSCTPKIPWVAKQ